MPDIEIGYKGSTIASMSSSGILTLSTAGKYCEDDITIDYIRAGITVVETLDQNGGTIVSITGNPITALQTKTVTPTSTTQTIVPDSGYSGLTSVIINGDSNLVSSNIVSGTSIFGITGTYQGVGWETAPEELAQQLVERTISGSVYGSMVLSLRNYAFANCRNITDASFPECMDIGSNAFLNCSNLTTISFPNCTSIGSCAFLNCNLVAASFPKITSLGYSIFLTCSNMISAFFQQCSRISASAFASCYNLTNISFPNCIYIDSGVFFRCSRLTSIFFSKCMNIGKEAFYSCINLTTISFPKSYAIYSSAFFNCTKLSQAYFLTSSVPTLSTSVFDNTPMTNSTYLGYYGSIYVPSSLLTNYKTATNWAALSDRMVGI